MTVSSPDSENTDTRPLTPEEIEESSQWPANRPNPGPAVLTGDQPAWNEDVCHGFERTPEVVPWTYGETDHSHVPTGDFRWTVDGDGDPAWVGSGLYVSKRDLAWNDEAHAALVRAVRDAARVPALQATARKWEQARELLMDLDNAERSPFAPANAVPIIRERLRDLLTEAPDGE